MVSRNLTKNYVKSSRFVLFVKIIYHWMRGLIMFFVPESLRLKTYKDITDQVVLVTGGGSGIGQLMALKFLKHGAKVVVWDINEQGLKRTKEMAVEQSKEFEKRIFLYQMDLSDRRSIYETAEKVKKEVGTVDILVNNAGVVSARHILDLPDEKIELTFKVNTLAHFFTIKAFLPDMIRKGQGHIVNVASIAGNFTASMVTDYCASKFANVGMHYALDNELTQAGLQDKIHTTLVRPYLINTGMFAGASSDFIRFLEPDEVAEKVVEAVLTNRKHVAQPWYLEYFVQFVFTLPEKCANLTLEFLGALDGMMSFHGRQPATKTNNQINDNNNFINSNNNNNNNVDKKEI